MTTTSLWWRRPGGSRGGEGRGPGWTQDASHREAEDATAQIVFGMIMPVAEHYIEEYFGPLPDEVLAEPKTWKGAQIHLRGAGCLRPRQRSRTLARQARQLALFRIRGRDMGTRPGWWTFAEWKTGGNGLQNAAARSCG